MKNSMTALVLAMFAMGSAGVFAQEPIEQERQQQAQEQQAQMEGKEFSQLDGDDDGNLNETEAVEAGIEPVTFDAMDVDSNQLVSEEEFQHAKEGGATR